MHPLTSRCPRLKRDPISEISSLNKSIDRYYIHTYKKTLHFCSLQQTTSDQVPPIDSMAETVRKSKRIKQPPLYLCDDYHILTIGSTQDEDVSPMDAEAVVDDHRRDPPVKQRRGRPLKAIDDPLSTNLSASTVV